MGTSWTCFLKPSCRFSVLCSQSEYQPRRKGQLALFSRHFPQPDLSTVVAPSGGVQRTQTTRERPPHYQPVQRTGSTIQQGSAGSPRTRRQPVFSCTCPVSTRLHSGGVQSTMGCKQYNRMLGLSRGYPHILYPSLNKWDAGPDLRFSTNSLSGESFLAAEDRQE